MQVKKMYINHSYFFHEDKLVDGGFFMLILFLFLGACSQAIVFSSFLILKAEFADIGIICCDLGENCAVRDLLLSLLSGLCEKSEKLLKAS